MKRIKDVTELVIASLKAHPQARNSDNYLYYIICKDRLEKQGLNIERLSFANALLQREAYDLPPFESVRRARQKAQVKYPELAALPEVECARYELQKDYLEYARSVV